MINFALAIVLWGAVALLMYSYIVYPILMSWIARRPRTGSISGGALDPFAPPSVTVVVAAFNEEKHIAARVMNLLQQDYPADQFRVLVGSDGSSDRTVELARGIADARLSVHDFGVNRGKASVLNDLVAQVNSDILVFTDANTVFNKAGLLGHSARAPCGWVHYLTRVALHSGDCGVGRLLGNLLLPVHTD